MTSPTITPANSLSILPDTALPQAEDSRRAVLDLSAEELNAWLKSVGEPSFRGRQIRRWLFRGRIRSFAEMQDLPVRLRSLLEQHFLFSSFEQTGHQIASDRTEKLLLRLRDGELVECVLMRDPPDRRTVCISTQVGCAMGCVFCASGLLGVKRNLTPAEIFEQVLVLHRLMDADEQITNVVVMGIGEPLANFRGLMAALDELTTETGFGLGAQANHSLDGRSPGEDPRVCPVGPPVQPRDFPACPERRTANTNRPCKSKHWHP